MTQLPLNDAELVSVQISRYKNILHLDLPWSRGVALFGANGAGKTNLLEALAIMIGSDRTLGLLGDRLTSVAQDSLGFIVREQRERLPLIGAMPFAATANKVDADDLPPTFRRLVADARWWGLLGATSGSDVAAGLVSAGIPVRVADFVGEQLEKRLVRYQLATWQHNKRDRMDGFMHEEGYADWLDEEEGPLFLRHYRRTLLAEQIPGWLHDHVEQLHDVFSPLASALAASPQDGQPVDLMTLPDVDDTPLLLDWLPRSRTSAEAVDHLNSSYQAAMQPISAVAGIFANAWTGREAFEPDVVWLLHQWAATAVGDELAKTVPHLSVEPVGEAGVDLRFRARGGAVPGRTANRANALERFSSGERRWVDEALATAARMFDQKAESYLLQAAYADLVEEYQLLGVLSEVTDRLEAMFAEAGYSTAEMLEIVLEAMSDAIMAAFRNGVAPAGESPESQIVRLINGEDIAPERTVIRVFDEPEAHLHPLAQRRVALALRRLSEGGGTVIVASHSPHFLDVPGWSLVHVMATPEGATYTPLTRKELTVRHALAAEMGLSGGELLSSISLLLIVEGEHDRRLLTDSYGPELQAAGVAIVCMRGTDQMPQLVQLDFIDHYLDVPVAILLDHTRTERLTKPASNESEEEEKLRKWWRASRRVRRMAVPLGLPRPDILAYIHEDIVREACPGFSGWRPLIDAYLAQRFRPAFKSFARDRFGVDLTDPELVRSLLERMHSSGLEPHGELTGVVKAIFAAADQQRWPVSPPSATE